MITSDKKVQEFYSRLNDTDKSAVETAINDLRNEAPFEGAVNMLLHIFEHDDSKAVRQAIINFFNDIKDNSVKTEILKEIKGDWQETTLNMLIASCWQSGLDYSSNLTDFAEIFVKSSYINAIECMTVICEFCHHIDQKAKDDIIRIINDNPLAVSGDKLPLAEKIISCISTANQDMDY